jgi:hypothetical protein
MSCGDASRHAVGDLATGRDPHVVVRPHAGEERVQHLQHPAGRDQGSHTYPTTWCRPSSVDPAELQRTLDDLHDGALFFHAFTDYMRDYELIVSPIQEPSLGRPPLHRRYLFKDCVEAQTETVPSAEIWRRSLDDRLIEFETGRDLDGYVWGVRWQELYPGAKVVAGSKRARRWTLAIGIDFHEVRIVANAHTITIVFSELDVSELAEGYVPFVIKGSSR